MKKYTVKILNIPNFWLNFYVDGLISHLDIDLKIDLNTPFKVHNFKKRLFLSLSVDNKEAIVVLDTDDPSPLHYGYKDADYVFLSQKLLKPAVPYENNVMALLPHYPFRTFKLFWLCLKSGNILLNWKTLKEFLLNFKLKNFDDLIKPSKSDTGFIFYYRSLWKDEYKTNLLGASFINFFKNAGFEVKGGLFRSDEYKTGNATIDSYIVKNKLSNREYINYLRKSTYVFNSPACRDALSWRFAEYLFANKTIISTDVKVEIPADFKYYVVSDENVESFVHDLSALTEKGPLDNSLMVSEVLMPVKQIDYILKKVFHERT
jgi:hypothetical protein